MEFVEEFERSRVVLELCVHGVKHCFTLSPSEERALVIGSGSAADLRLREPGIRPVHCHFECLESGVWLVPTACAGRLRVDGGLLRGPRQLERRSLLAVGATTIEVRWFAEVRGTLVAQALAPRSAVSRGRETPRGKSALAHVKGLADEMDITSMDGHALNAAVVSSGARGDTWLYGTPNSNAILTQQRSVASRGNSSLPPAVRQGPQFAWTRTRPAGGPQSAVNKRSQRLMDCMGDTCSKPPRVWQEWPAALEGVCPGAPRPKSGPWLAGLGWVRRLGVATKRRPLCVLSLSMAVALLVSSISSQLIAPAFSQALPEPLGASRPLPQVGLRR